MRVYDLLDTEGRVFAFEIDSFPIGRKGVVRVVSSIPGTSVKPQPRNSNRDDFCEFVVAGRVFVASEPWGDNSRYWIGPNPAVWCEELRLVRQAFSDRGPWPWSRERPSRR